MNDTADLQYNETTAHRRRAFLPGPEKWPSDTAYRYCPLADDVYASTTAHSCCPHCDRSDHADIFALIGQRLVTVWRFLDAMMLPTRPFGHCKESPRDEAFSLWASYRALSTRNLLVRYGFQEPYSQAQIRQWCEMFLSYRDPASGLVGDDHNLSNRLAEAFTKAGFPDLYDVPLTEQEERDPLQTEDDLAEFLSDDMWETNPWGKGSHVQWAVRVHQDVLRRTGRPDDGMIDSVHRWLDEQQDPETGYWRGARATLNNRACGAYKLICWLYRPRGWHIHHIDRMIDTTLALQSERGDFGDSGFGCQVFDPLLLLKVGRDRRPGYRRNDVDAAAARCYLTLNDHWDPDHGFFKNAHGEVRLNNMVELPIALYMAELLLGISYFDADRCNE